MRTRSGRHPRRWRRCATKLDQLHLYPDGDCFYLKQGLSRKLGVAPESLIFGNGSNEIIELAARTFLRPGDEAVMAEQAFVVYQLIVQTVGGRSRAVPLQEFHPRSGRSRRSGVAAHADDFSRQSRTIPPARSTGGTTGSAFSTKISPDALLIVDEAYFEYVQRRRVSGLARATMHRAAPCSRCERSRSFTAWRACASATASARRS